jgi:hypothetical protein
MPSHRPRDLIRASTQGKYDKIWLMRAYFGPRIWSIGGIERSICRAGGVFWFENYGEPSVFIENSFKFWDQNNVRTRYQSVGNSLCKAWC